MAALFAVFGVVLLGGLVPHGWVDAGDVLIGVFMVGVALPALIVSYREVRRDRHSGDGWVGT